MAGMWHWPVAARCCSDQGHAALTLRMPLLDARLMEGLCRMDAAGWGLNGGAGADDLCELGLIGGCLSSGVSDRLWSCGGLYANGLSPISSFCGSFLSGGERDVGSELAGDSMIIKPLGRIVAVAAIETTCVCCEVPQSSRPVLRSPL
jgi:hypothetical protein